MKSLFFAAAVAFFCVKSGTAQIADPAVNASVMPNSITQNGTAVVTVVASNTGDGAIAASSLEVTIMAGANAEITGINMNSTATWTLVSATTGTNNMYKLQNTNGGVSAFDGENILLNISGTVPGTSIIFSSIDYLPGNNANLGGAANNSQGNGQLDNDTSSTTLVVTPSMPLPVRLLSFSGVAKKCSAVLSWQAASEEWLDRYELEESADGQHFTTVATRSSQKAAGNKSYSVITSPAAPKSYYRLKMTGTNGETTRSNILSVVTTCNEAVVAIFPNPVKNTATVTGVSAGEVVEVYTAAGQLVSRTSCTENRTQLHLEGLPAGTYRAVIAGPDRYLSVALVKTD